MGTGNVFASKGAPGARQFPVLPLVFLFCLLPFLGGCSLFYDAVPGNVPITSEGAETGTFMAGAGAADISPDGSVYMGGFNILRSSEGVKHPLSARALLLKRGDVELLLVALDLVGVLYDDALELRKAVVDIDPTRIVIAATHNHHSPDSIGVWGLPPIISGLDDAYMAKVKAGVIEAYKQARESLRPAEVGYGSIVFEAQRFIKNVNHSGLIDPEIVVLHLRDCETKETIAALTELGCHPEAARRWNTLITADYPHFARIGLEQAFGGTAIYVSGALGGLVSPETTGYGPDKPEEMWGEVARIGGILADYSIAAVREIRSYSSDPLIAFWNWPVFVENDNFLYDLVQFTGIVNRKRYKRGYLKTEVNLWQIGDFRVATIPGEITPDLGMRIKRNSGGSVTMLIGLANDEGGYLLPAVDYNAPYFDYERSLSFSRNAAELIVRKLEALGDLSRYPRPRKLEEVRKALAEPQAEASPKTQ